MHVRPTLFVAPLTLAFVFAAGQARAFCRTMTCRLPADFSPNGSECFPPDFAAQCAAQNPPVKLLPLYWLEDRISFDVQKDASAQIPYGVADPIVLAAFAKWTSATCLGLPGAPRVGIDVVDLGAVDCTQVQYNSYQPNQNLIVFRDALNPTAAQHFSGTNTLGLTTVTFNPDTGQLYDADTEINATVMLSVGDPVNGYDFESIITHEAGHFLGLAHSADASATMFAQYSPGSTSMRTLTADDVAGLCSIYPGSSRNVDPSVAASGQLLATSNPRAFPRWGYSSKCAQPQQSNGCAIAAADGFETGPSTAGLVLVGLVSAGIARTRMRARATVRKR